MANRSGLLWFVGLLSLSSCITFEKYPIEVYKPSSYFFPNYIHTVGIVSRNLKYTNDTLQNYLAENGRLVKEKKPFDTDYIAKKVCLDSLAKKLDSKNSFDSVFVIPVESFREIKVKDIRPAVPEWYKSIADKSGADALILLDMFSCFYSIDDRSDNPQVNIITSNIWSVYDARATKIVDRFRQIDTLYWNGYDDEGNYRKIKLPDKKEAIRLAAGVIAQSYAKHIISDWTMVYREIIFNGNHELANAAKLAKKGEWEKAKTIWQKCQAGHIKKNRIISLYNLSLACEMDGDIDKALELTAKAASESSGVFHANLNQATKEYSAILYKRKIELQKLKQQNEIQ